MNKVSENALEESINFAQEICKAAPIAVKTTVKALRCRQEAVGLGLEVCSVCTFFGIIFEKLQHF